MNMHEVVESADARFISRLTSDTLALVLAGGRGSRLHELTRWRAKPSLFFGGKFRIIDFPLSNCINSGIRKNGRADPVQGTLANSASGAGAGARFPWKTRSSSRSCPRRSGSAATGISAPRTQFIRTSTSSASINRNWC